MGRELAEGKLHAVERQAALAKTFADDLRVAFAAVEDHAHALDAENEELQAQLFALSRTQHERFGRPDRGFQGAFRAAHSRNTGYRATALQCQRRSRLHLVRVNGAPGACTNDGRFQSGSGALAVGTVVDSSLAPCRRIQEADAAARRQSRL